MLSSASCGGFVSHKVHEELVGAIKDAEEGLLHLKRARLLQEADIVLHGLNHDAGVKAEHLNPASANELEPEKIEEKKDLDGSKCRFRHTDGRWYNGRIIGFEGSDSAKISFLTPTSESMMVRFTQFHYHDYHVWCFTQFLCFPHDPLVFFLQDF